MQNNIAFFTDYRFVCLPTPTGVTKHAYFMAKGLVEDPNFHVSGLVAADQVGRQGLLDFLPPQRMPLNWALARELWTWTGRPLADRWIEGADWVYCPKNDWIPVNKAKYAVTIHGAHELDPAFKPKAKGLRSCYASLRAQRQYLKICERADVILTVSEWLKNFVVEQFHADQRKIVVVGNGVDRVFYEVQETLSVSPYILCLGGLNYIDGGDRILALARLLAKEWWPGRIKVAGHLHDPDMLRESEGVGNIDLLGYVASGDLAPLMAAAAVFYYPTRYETFGMGAAEAMAAGTPVITCDCTAVPEIVGDCGIYVSPEKEGEVMDAILSLVNNNFMRQQLVDAAKERAKKFKWEDCINRLKLVLS